MISQDMNGSRDADLKLIQRILTGERDLFHDLVKPYERGVYVALLSMLKHAADAEDAAQEVMLKAYRSLRLFRGDAKFSTWLMTIALNEGRSRLGKSARKKESSLDEEIDKHS